MSRTEFVVLEEGKSEPIISCADFVCVKRIVYLILKTRRVKVKRDSSAWFKCCLPASVSSPD